MAICKSADLKTRIGTVIPSIEGKIVSVFPPKEGKGQHGDWKLQNIVIEDETGKTQVTLSGVDTVSELCKGRNIYFESVGTKFGLKGVSCEESSYVDKKSGSPVTKVGVKVTKTAVIKLEGQDVVQNNPEENVVGLSTGFTGYNAPSIVKTLEIKQNPPQASTTPNLVDQMKRYEVLYQKCIERAVNVKKPTIHGDKELSEDNQKDIASCFFIQAIKDGLLSQVAIGDFKNPEDKTEEEPF